MQYIDLHKLFPQFSFFKKIFLTFAVVLSFTSIMSGQQASAITEQRVRAYIEALNSNKWSEWKKFLGENYSKTALERTPIEVRLGNFSRVYDENRGLIIQGVRQTKPNEVTVDVKNKLTGQEFELAALVEEQSPFYLTSIILRAKPVTNKKLSDQAIITDLDNHLKKLAEADVFSGTVLVARGNKVLYEKAFGEANKDFKVPNNINTKFNLGSMNKMFTAVAIAQLAEAGKLSFEDPLDKFMPGFPDKESAQKIKIKHLLSHTSGLGNYFNQTFFDSSRARFRTVDDFLELAKDEKMAFESGTRWQYSNTGMLILGKIIEKVSGQNYFDYIRENVYKKAGMTDSDSYDLDSINPNLAVGYDKDYTEKGIVFRNNIFLHVIRGGPAGGGYSTVNDLLKFANAFRAGKLVSEEYVKILTSAKPELSSPNYGYGFFASPYSTGHSGGFPGISSELIIFTNSDYTAITLSNYGLGSQNVGPKIRGLIQACADCQATQK